MKAVADYIHEKGFKFGMYSCCGTRTCADYPGSLEHEYEDAKQFAAWGVDYLKYDNCFKPQHLDDRNLYRRMGLALANCGRDIVFSACQWGTESVHEWIRSSGAHLFRSTGGHQRFLEFHQRHRSLPDGQNGICRPLLATTIWICW